MGFKQQTPRKRSLRPFRKVNKTKRRPLDLTPQHTLTRGDYGPKEKPMTIQADSDIRTCFHEGEVI